MSLTMATAGNRTEVRKQRNSPTDLYLDDFIKEGLWVLLKLKLEVLKEESR